MFDRLMLLAKGRVIYFNEARFAVDYFSSINYKCPELSNPADYFMGIMSIESIEKPDTDDKLELEQSQRDILKIYEETISSFCDNYKKSHLVNDPNNVDPSVRALKDNDPSNKQTSSWCYQFQLLAKRNFLNLTRLP